ncbi:outer membrane efflux protein [Desulfitobacterium sp. LBE]|uniref:TolC family protein n=1 Tax=Desulfitobacterium TaxID=36853 RepID=UPI00037F6D14|nr:MULTISPECIES: TolC family protein [Desulfitobacterium]TWH57354.1 outer membrane efflux protein [Desulfitobacterium sp. LBE]
MKKILSLVMALIVIIAVSVPMATLAGEETAGADNTTVKSETGEVVEAVEEIESVETVEAVEAVEAVTVIDTLSLEKAYETIEEHNQELKLMNDKINLYEKQYQEAVARSDWAKGKFIGGDEEQNVTYRKEELLYPKQRLLELDGAKHEREEKLKELKAGVKKQYLEIGVFQEELANTQSELAALDKTIEHTQTQINSGSLPQSALKQYDAQRVQMLSRIEATQRQISLNLKGLERDLGVKLAGQTKLEPLAGEPVLFDDGDIANEISKAWEDSYDYLSQQGQLELAEIECDIIRYNTYIDNNLNQLHQLEASVSNNQAKLEQVKPNLEATLWNKYYELKNLEGDLEIEKINLEDAEYTLSITQSKEGLGTAKGSSVVDDTIALNQQKVKLQKAINAYSLAVDELNSLLTK